MVKQTRLCDRCGVLVPDDQRYALEFVERRPNGPRMVDLCKKCHDVLVLTLKRNLPAELIGKELRT